MGTIKLDTITPLSNTNDITIASNKFVGTASGTMTVVGEGGTTQTNLQQGLCKAWCRFDDGASSDSFNVSSVTDHGTGDYQVFIANDMANATYIATLMFGETGGSGVLRIGNRDLAAASVGCVGTNGDQSTGQDINRCGVDVAGDLA